MCENLSEKMLRLCTLNNTTTDNTVKQLTTYMFCYSLKIVFHTTNVDTFSRLLAEDAGDDVGF